MCFPKKWNPIRDIGNAVSNTVSSIGDAIGNTVSSAGDVVSGALKEAEKFVGNTLGSLEATVNSMVTMAEKNPLEFTAHVALAVASGGQTLTAQQAMWASAALSTTSALARGEKLEDALVAGAKSGAMVWAGAQAGDW